MDGDSGDKNNGDGVDDGGVNIMVVMIPIEVMVRA